MSDSDYVVATRPLFVGTARAHNIGDLVPKANVKPNGWEDGTANHGTKAANEALGVAAETLEAPQTAAVGPPLK